MASTTDTFDLGRLGLTSGEGRRLDLTIDLPPLLLADQEYRSQAAVPVRLDVSRTTGAGYSIKASTSCVGAGPPRVATRSSRPDLCPFG